MTEQEVQDWLNAYGAAWIEGDPDAIVVLFTPAATYRETPFDEVMSGRDEIRAYWQEGAADGQQDLRFSSQVWAVSDRTAVAGWQAGFTRRKTGAKVDLDGTFRLEFDVQDGNLLCSRLEEWWHRKES